MKNSILASMLFGALAVAAPVDRRSLAYKTEIVVETVVVYTTVYDEYPVASATTTPAGYFYEQPATPSADAQPTSTPAAAPAPAPEKPSSAYVAPPPPSPTPVDPSPAPVVESPKPIESPKPAESPKPVEIPQPAPAPAPAPAPVSSAAPAPAPAPEYTPAPAPAPAPAPSKPSSGGAMTFNDVDMTVYNNLKGDFGACGKPLYDSDLIVALSKEAWGASTYDVMTGEATNPWCGQQIEISYNGGEPKIATILDMCPGCSGHDIDLSPAAWKAVTGTDELTRYKASWRKVGGN